MKIVVNQDPSCPETEIIVNCRQADEDLLKLIAMLRVYQQKLAGILEGEQHLLDVKEVLYIDTVDKKTFLYTEKGVYQSALRLYELEDALKEMDFFRAGRSTILNVCRIRSLRPELGRMAGHHGQRRTGLAIPTICRGAEREIEASGKEPFEMKS